MVYVTGDMHGDEERLYTKEMRRLKEGDTLIVAGDFGFIWDGGRREQRLLKAMGKRKYNICFIDGPHDNYDRIYACRETVWKGGRVHRISRNLLHLCRGQVFTIEGQTIFTFGGGESADKEIRAENQKWFKEELPTPAQMEEGARNIDEYGCVVDYIITHEPPSVIKSALQLRAGKTIYVNKLNGYLEELNRACKFKRWYFGSVHEDRVITPSHIAVFRELLPIDQPVDPVPENELIRL